MYQCLSWSTVIGETGAALHPGLRGPSDRLSRDASVVGLSGNSIGSLGIGAGPTSCGGAVLVLLVSWSTGTPLRGLLSLLLMNSPTMTAPMIKAIRPP